MLIDGLPEKRAKSVLRRLVEPGEIVIEVIDKGATDYYMARLKDRPHVQARGGTPADAIANLILTMQAANEPGIKVEYPKR